MIIDGARFVILTKKVQGRTMQKITVVEAEGCIATYGP
jgi:hypothetical protein